MMYDQTPFRELEIALQKHISSMVDDPKNNLFTVDLDKDILWNIYLGSFPEGTNPVLKTRTEHDCNACKHFIRQFGNVVLVKNNTLTSIWDFQLPGNSRYNPVLTALSDFIKSRSVEDVFFAESAKIGTEKNLVQDKETGTVCTWEHLYVKIPDRFVPKRRDTLGTLRSQSRANRSVFARSLEEINPDAVQTVLELISQNSLYKGEEWKETLKSFREHQKAYSRLLTMSQRELYTWEQSLIAGPVVSKIKNHSIGVLLTDITTGMDLDEAVRRCEKIVAPSNYKRPKAIFTKKMLEDAERTLTELGYLESLGRRFANLEDISVRDTLFVNRDIKNLISDDNNSEISAGKIFQDMKNSVPQNSRSFSRVEEIPIEKFISDILPHTQKIEVLVENRHVGNMVSLIAPMNSATPSILKWPNGFSWAYKGNMTDSMKERVKALGGDVEGVLRFSIQWNDQNDNPDDLDAHCIEPNGNEIYYMNKRHVHRSSGVLDVDIIQPGKSIAVENITYSNLREMPGGTYKFFVHCFNRRNSKSGFTAEVEFDGQIHSFAYNQPLKQGEKVQVAEVTFDKKSKSFSIIEKIPSSVSSRKFWGLDTQQFHEVSVMTLSPNYWNSDDGDHHVGNKHYFFMLKGCTNDDTPNGFFNEYLKEDLLKHKRVFEALGAKMQVPPSENQLSGLGFSSTQRNSVIAKVEGERVNRTVKIIF